MNFLRDVMAMNNVRPRKQKEKKSLSLLLGMCWWECCMPEDYKKRQKCWGKMCKKEAHPGEYQIVLLVI